MTCGVGTYVSGSYTGTITPIGGPIMSLGTTDDGFEIEMNHSIQEITADQWGDSVHAGIYRGGNCFVNATFLEFNTDAAQWLRSFYSNGLSSGEGYMGVIGCEVAANYSVELYLSRVSPPDIADNNNPDNYRFWRCVLDPNFPIRWSLQSRLWTLPVRFRVLPYQPGVGAAYRWYDIEDNS